MRHRVASKQLNRDTKHREALLKNLLRELVEHGTITTTITKAKVVKPVADKLVTTAKVGTVAARRNLHAIFGKRDVVNTLVERVAPALQDRTSGYTRITRLGVRSGDNATMVQLSWVAEIERAGTLAAPVKAEKTAEKKIAKKTVSTPAAAPKKSTEKTKTEKK